MRTTITVCLALTVTACHHDRQPIRSTPAPERLVAVSSVVNAIKCELAETFADNRLADTVGFDAPDDKDIAATLTLGETFTTKASTDGGITIPLGIELGGSASTSSSNSTGQSFKLAFDYNLETNGQVPPFCKILDENIRVQGDPFLEMLEAVNAEYSKLESGQPTVQLGSISYTSDFSVERSSELGGSVSFLIFEFGSERSRTSKTNQSLTLTFKLNSLPKVTPL